MKSIKSTQPVVKPRTPVHENEVSKKSDKMKIDRPDDEHISGKPHSEATNNSNPIIRSKPSNAAEIDDA